MSPDKRMVWLDALRLWAGISMVGLHASSDIRGLPFVDFEPIERVGPVLFRAIVYTARTELFLIISLFLLVMSLDRRVRGYRETIAEQARRLLIPFLFWVVFFAFYRLLKANYFGYSDAIWMQLADPFEWAKYVSLGSVHFHMHFLPTLFGLVLFYPLYRLAVAQPWLGLVVILCLFAKREIDVWIWAQFHDLDWFAYLRRAVKLATYAGYGIVAASFYGIYRQGLNDAAQKTYFYIAIYLAFLLFLIKLVYSHKVILNGDWQYSFTPAYWADFLMPALLFLIFMAAPRNWFSPVISKLAPYSFGIYLVHPVILAPIEIWLWDVKLSPSLFVGIKTVLGIAGAAALTWALSKTHLLAWTVGLGPLPWLRKRNSKLIEERT